MIKSLCQMLNHLNDSAKYVIDAIAGIITLATLISWLPHATAGLSFFWIILRIYNEYLINKKLRKEDQ